MTKKDNLKVKEDYLQKIENSYKRIMINMNNTLQLMVIKKYQSYSVDNITFWNNFILCRSKQNQK